MSKEKFATKAEQGEFLDDKAAKIRKEIIRLAPIVNGGHLSGGLSLVDLSGRFTITLCARATRHSMPAMGSIRMEPDRLLQTCFPQRRGGQDEVAVL